ncbi:MAG: ATP-binding cassette domain-containing protein [Cellvibrionales bacterium]|nr:ATP-binding cassette domain-containing protein [Cellvibrionales bacterium]
MLQITQLDLQRSGKPLFEKAQLTLHSGQRFALIGNNGCGKSSLFQVILQQLDIDGGEVLLPDRWKVAHMAQDIQSLDRPAVDYVIDGFTELRATERALAEAEQHNDHTLIVKLHEKLDAMSAYTINHRAESILQGLGFSASDNHRAVGEFSGGWRIRLNLARALLNPGDLLLLDEPTNHLDVEAIFWLEQWIKQFSGSLILISHDRDFIDQTASHIAHIESHQINTYKGSYSDFERQRAEKLNQQQAQHDKQQAQIKHMQSYIDRFKAKATKAKQAQSRIKALERMQLVAAVKLPSEYHFDIPLAEKTGSPLIRCENLNVGYGDTTIVSQINFTLEPGMRVGLLGENGAGKSTLLKSLVGEIPVLSGEKLDHKFLSIGYFAQHQIEALDYDASPILHIQRIAPKASEQSIRDFLGRFLIKGDMATDTIRHFSGGEKARLALALVAWHKPNLLILDEPTNHLDINMREALAEAISTFEGAVVLVSHDRYLLRHCVDELYRIHDGMFTEFSGDLADYQKAVAKDAKALADKPSAQAPVDKKQARVDAAKARQATAPIRKRIKHIEKDLDKHQARLNTILEKISQPEMYEDANKAELKTLLAEEIELKTAIETLEESWMEEQEKLQD